MEDHVLEIEYCITYTNEVDHTIILIMLKIMITELCLILIIDHIIRYNDSKDMEKNDIEFDQGEELIQFSHWVKQDTRVDTIR